MTFETDQIFDVDLSYFPLPWLLILTPWNLRIFLVKSKVWISYLAC